MARSRMILPAYDPACRRLFHSDRLTAEGHRVTLEIWLRATGREDEGVRVVVYRCKRCSGFHVARRKTPPKPACDARSAELIEIEMGSELEAEAEAEAEVEAEAEADELNLVMGFGLRYSTSDRGVRNSTSGVG